MNKEDYNKYYIQGSDHYLIPKDIFKELFNEMVNWREEAKELKKQLTTYKILHRDCKVDNLKNISKIEEKETQQKEFIKYLEDNWNTTQDIWYIKILQKYKEIVKSQSSLKQKCHNESLWFEVNELLNKIQELEGDNNE